VTPDLRIEHRGRVAQIDHLLINRWLDIFVLEPKNYDYGVKIREEGGARLGWEDRSGYFQGRRSRPAAGWLSLLVQRKSPKKGPLSAALGMSVAGFYGVNDGAA
jgi:hypothetical protein